MAPFEYESADSYLTGTEHVIRTGREPFPLTVSEAVLLLAGKRGASLAECLKDRPGWSIIERQVVAADSVGSVDDQLLVLMVALEVSYRRKANYRDKTIRVTGDEKDRTVIERTEINLKRSLRMRVITGLRMQYYFNARTTFDKLNSSTDAT